MLEQQRQRLLTQLQKIDVSLRKHPTPDIGKVGRRIGRWLGRYSGAERLIEVTVQHDTQGSACGLNIVEKSAHRSWSELAHGAYLLRTNCTETDPRQLWRWYIHLTQAEESFKISKSDLHLRPVFHQKEDRVDAHILVCFLTLALWRTLEMWMRGKDLGNCARQLLKEVATVRSMDVMLPIKSEGEDRPTELHLRVVARPERMVAELLHRLGLDLPNVPKIVQNVVPKTTP